MAAGLGFKDFATGEVLTAADVDGYLMQGIWVFASAAARDAAVTSPQEGNACYLKDTNQVLTYNGSAWVAVGGGSPLTTKGDLYTFSTVDARLGVGANGTTLVADSAEATGLKWAAASSGAVAQVKSTAKFDTFSMSLAGYTDVTGLSVSITPTSASNKVYVMVSIGQVDSSSGSGMGFNIVRDSTQVGGGTAVGSRISASSGYENAANTPDMFAYSFLDSPGTTSATTYKVQMYALGATNAYINRSSTDGNSDAYMRTTSTITVMEVTP
jgi:hypothetical protein